ncbi:acyl-CoA dehydrogenase family protein [Alphaproteobacteria bacterium]|nr:acyl-CoA dehydrogenase family protein [Alphaproteobacteria bacterium]
MNSKEQWLDPLYLDTFLNEDEIFIKENTKKFCEKFLIPRVVEDNKNHFFDKNLYKEFGKMGLLGSTVKGYGSPEINKVSYGLIAFEIERIDSSYRSAISVQSSLVCHPIEHYGTDKQKIQYLPELINGNIIGCFGLTESEAGSDPSSMKTSFVEKKNHYLLNGSKNWITNAPIADIFLIWALNEKKEVNLFLVPKNTKGLIVSEIKNKTSLKISPTGQILLDNVKIPRENILPNTKGWKSVFSCLNNARYGIAWGTLGAATASWLIAKDYTENRIMFKKPLASNQLIQKKLAIMQTEISIGLSSCLHAGRAYEKGRDIKIAVSMLKRNNCKKAIEIVRESRDMMGANGLLEEYHIMRHLVNLETVKTYEGAEDIHALILGKFQTKLDSF